MILFKEIEKLVKGDTSKCAEGNNLYTFVRPVKGFVFYEEIYSRSAQTESLFFPSKFDSRFFLSTISKRPYSSEPVMDVIGGFSSKRKRFILEFLDYPREIETTRRGQFLFLKSKTRGVIIF